MNIFMTPINPSSSLNPQTPIQDAPIFNVPPDIHKHILKFAGFPSASLVCRTFKQENDLTMIELWNEALPRLESNPIISQFIQRAHITPEVRGSEKFRRLYEEMKGELSPIVLKNLQKTYPIASAAFFEALLGELQNSALIQCWANIQTLLTRANIDAPELTSAELIRQWMKDNSQIIQRVRKLRLANLNISILPDEINLFINLIHLQVEKSYLKLLSSSSLDCLQALQGLWVNDNQIQSFIGLPSLPALQELSVDNNQIQSFIHFPNLQALKVLFVDNNQIQNFTNFPSSQALQELRINNNRIHSWEGLSNTQRRFVRIRINTIPTCSLL
jgi:hypothetical protein